MAVVWQSISKAEHAFPPEVVISMVSQKHAHHERQQGISDQQQYAAAG
uniref:Uncharacterized protein n=1 Tax=Klebsiella pneumoniae TaxID=573 RepID=A0A6G9HLN4_KLEPN|nr:hypothetical protein [Klebsiella pneumoniae]